MHTLIHNHSQDNHRQHQHQYYQQTARLPSCALLVPARRPQLLICVLRVVSRLHDILADDVQALPLLMNHMRHISEQLVQLSYRLLDIPDL